MFKTFFCFFCVISVLSATEEDSEVDVSKISESLGHMIGKNLDNLGIPLDIHLIAKGIHEALEGTQPPLSEDECYEALTTLQENEHRKQAHQNLVDAENFLKKNQAEEGVISLFEGKLQYRILEKGSGNSVEPYNSPIIRYSGKYLDGSKFGSSEDVELISLDETIEGFRKGIVGMKEGEKRILYIHPDLGYGQSGFLPPNSLLTFEIEVIHADGSKKPTVQKLKAKAQGEIASSVLDDEKKLR